MSTAGWTLGMQPRNVVATLGLLKARDAAIMRAGIELQGEWKSLLNQPGGGKMYEAGTGFITTDGVVVPITGQDGSRGSAHRASSPKEPPAPDKGTLKNSIAVVDMGDGTVRVGTGQRIGLALEYGVNVSGSRTGPHPGKNFVLQPRPHARPAKENATSGMTDTVAATFAAITIPRVSVGGKGGR